MTLIYIQYSRYDTRKTLYGLASTPPPPAERLYEHQSHIVCAPVWAQTQEHGEAPARAGTLGSRRACG